VRTFLRELCSLFAFPRLRFENAPVHPRRRREKGATATKGCSGDAHHRASAGTASAFSVLHSDRERSSCFELIEFRAGTRCRAGPGRLPRGLARRQPVVHTRLDKDIDGLSVAKGLDRCGGDGTHVRVRVVCV